MRAGCGLCSLETAVRFSDEAVRGRVVWREKCIPVNTFADKFSNGVDSKWPRRVPCMRGFRLLFSVDNPRDLGRALSQTRDTFESKNWPTIDFPLLLPSSILFEGKYIKRYEKETKQVIKTKPRILA